MPSPSTIDGRPWFLYHNQMYIFFIFNIVHQRRCNGFFHCDDNEDSDIQSFFDNFFFLFHKLNKRCLQSYHYNSFSSSYNRKDVFDEFCSFLFIQHPFHDFRNHLIQLKSSTTFAIPKNIRMFLPWSYIIVFFHLYYLSFIKK